MQLVSPVQMKMIEEESERLGVSTEQLMLNAGSVLAGVIDDHCRTNMDGDPELKSIVFLTGPGNNGGDCFAAAEKLLFRGYDITIIGITPKSQKKPASTMYEKLTKNKIKFINAYRSKEVSTAIEAAELDYMTVPNDTDPAKLSEKDKEDLNPLEKIMVEEKARIGKIVEAIKGADVLVDGVFGTGFHGELEPEIAALFDVSTNAYKIAVDIPSGGCGDTGAVSNGAFKADETVVLGLLKIGLTQYPLKSFCGRIRVHDIGIPEKALETDLGSRLFSLIDMNALQGFPAKREPNSYKSMYGHVLVICGSLRMRGAAVLSTYAALRSGAGLVCLASCEEACNAAASVAPCATFMPLETDDFGCLLFDVNKPLLDEELEQCDAVLIGCGMGVTPDTIEIVRYVVKNAKCPVIIDADGINCLASDIDILEEHHKDIIITPHAGEMARLLGCTNSEVNADRFAAAEKFAEEHGITVLLKGAGSLVSDGQYTAVNSTGNPGMSRGGSGDVLSGIVAAFAAMKYDPFDAAGYAAYVHGLAGDITAEQLGQDAMLPTDIIERLSDAFKLIRKNNGMI